MKVCLIEGCGKKHCGSGFCGMHYARFRKHGDPNYIPPVLADPGCKIDGCKNSFLAKGLCRMHYSRFQRHGDFEHGRPQAPLDENNMRRCKKCGAEKPLGEFSKHPECFGGRTRTCTSCENTVRRESYWRDPGSVRTRARKARLFKLFRITPEEWSAFFEKQGGVCAICGLPELPNRRLAVDHNHTTGKVRGLLCRACNTAIGFLKDSTATLSAAIEYINRDGG